MTSPDTAHNARLGMNTSVILALFSIYVIWGATELGNQFARESYPPFLLVALRLLFAWLILLGVLKVQGIAFPSMRKILNALLIGGLMFGGRSGMTAFAQGQGLGFGMLSLGVATVPLWAMIFAFSFGYRPSRLEIIGLIVGMFGMVILNIGNDFQSEPLAVIILLFAPMIWAFGSYYTKQISLPDGFMATAFQMMGGCIVLFVMSFLRGEQFPTNPTMNATVALFFLSIFGTLVAFSAYMYLVRVVSPGLATSYAYVNPVVAGVLSLILIGDPISITTMIAIAVIGAGVILVMMGKSKFMTSSAG